MLFDQKIEPQSADVPQVVYVVDDSADILEVIQVLLNSVNLKVKTFTSGEEFLSQVDHTARGCLLLDMRMPGMSGLEVQDALKEHCITLPVIFLTGHGEVTAAVQAMREGALDFIEKPFQPQLLLDRIHACLKLNGQINAEQCKKKAAENRVKQLSPREYEVAKLIVAGKPSKVIGSALGISEKTVDVHRHKIMKKVLVRSVAELVQLWLDTKQEIA
jgi:two-component system, LuxR family, response regulator FixJ